MTNITMNINRALQFGKKIWIVGILIISIIWSVEATSFCQLFMCIKPDGSAAVATIANPTNIIAAQEFIADSCPGVTDITKCYIDCDGPYNAYETMAYWSWKGCDGNVVGNDIWDYTCDASVLKVCKLGQDPDYPFNH